MPKAKSPQKSQSTSNSDPQRTASITMFQSSANSRSDVEERIRERAYNLFLERGGKHGYAEEDWLRAEAEILGHHQRRTA